MMVVASLLVLMVVLLSLESCRYELFLPHSFFNMRFCSPCYT